VGRDARKAGCRCMRPEHLPDRAVRTGKLSRGRMSKLPFRGGLLSQVSGWQIPFWRSARLRALPAPPRS
jgi:hypothetical protein